MSKGKTCGDCRHFDGRYNLCAVTSDFCTVEPDYSACDDFEQKPKPTNGDRIRQGGDDALIDFADSIRRKMCHYCAFFTDKSCVDKAGDCWEGVRTWLNAPVESEGKDE